MRFLDFFKKVSWLKKVIILNVLILLAVVGIYKLVDHQKKVQIEKKNKRIIEFCEDFKWKDDKRRNKGAKFENDESFNCGDNLFLKPKVKKSSTGICHDEKSMYYYSTKIYRSFDSIENCIKDNGRKPYK